MDKRKQPPVPRIEPYPARYVADDDTGGRRLLVERAPRSGRGWIQTDTWAMVEP